MLSRGFNAGTDRYMIDAMSCRAAHVKTSQRIKRIRLSKRRISELQSPAANNLVEVKILESAGNQDEASDG
jgi:hypothetical protein